MRTHVNSNNEYLVNIYGLGKARQVTLNCLIWDRR